MWLCGCFVRDFSNPAAVACLPRGEVNIGGYWAGCWKAGPRWQRAKAVGQLSGRPC